MTPFYLTLAARAGLDAIWDCTAQRSGVAKAERYVAAIVEVCRAVAAGAYPDRDAGEVRPGYRKAPVGSHVLWFRRRPDGAPEVIRILHQRMDGPRHLT